MPRINDKIVTKNHTYHQLLLFFFSYSSNKNDKYLQAILKITPWIPFVSNLVLSPLNINPLSPSFLITSWNACLYVIWISLVCLMVLMTRIEFEIVSDTRVQVNPIVALRKRAIRGYSRKL